MPSEFSLLFDLFAVHSEVRQLLARAMADAPLRPDEYAVYSVLFENGPTTPTQLAQSVGMPATTVSDYVRALVTRKHAEKVANPGDARSYRLLLTPSGLAAHEASSRLFEQAMSRVRENLTSDPVQLQRCLLELHAAVRKASASLEAEAVATS